jgi:hypothetical protein
MNINVCLKSTIFSWKCHLVLYDNLMCWIQRKRDGREGLFHQRNWTRGVSEIGHHGSTKVKEIRILYIKSASFSAKDWFHHFSLAIGRCSHHKKLLSMGASTVNMSSEILVFGGLSLRVCVGRATGLGPCEYVVFRTKRTQPGLTITFYDLKLDSVCAIQRTSLFHLIPNGLEFGAIWHCPQTCQYQGFTSPPSHSIQYRLRLIQTSL